MSDAGIYSPADYFFFAVLRVDFFLVDCFLLACFLREPGQPFCMSR